MISIIGFFPLLILALTSVVSTTPIFTSGGNKAEIYYLVNCFNNITFDAYASIDYYKKSALSLDGQKPNEIAILDASESIDYEDGTWTTATPFYFTCYIDVDAYTATAGTLIGSANTTSGPLECYRLTRFVLYQPKLDEQCYTDYACYE